MNDRINSNLIDANIKLQDENNLLKIDKKMLETRIKKAIEYIKSNDNYFLSDSYMKLLEILKGEVAYD